MTYLPANGTPHAGDSSNEAPASLSASEGPAIRAPGSADEPRQSRPAAGESHGGTAAPARATGREPEVYALPGSLSLWQIWGEDLARHDGDWTLPGFRALAVHRFGVWHRTVKNIYLRKVLSRIWLMLYRYVRNHYGIELPYTAVVGRRVRLEHQGAITIHGFARIGDDCVLRQGVTLGNRSVEQPFLAPVLGSRVDVGAGAVIVGDVVVGDGARVGANAVVLTDVPPGATAVGVPARIVSAR